MNTYASLTDCALSESVEVVEKFLNTDLTLEDLSLHPFFNVKFDVNHICWLSNAKATEIPRVALSDRYRTSKLRNRVNCNKWELFNGLLSLKHLLKLADLKA